MVEIGIVSVCGNTMCYLNYREAEVQVLKIILTIFMRYQFLHMTLFRAEKIWHSVWNHGIVR